MQAHQSGELALRPLTPDEDRVRGMLGGIIAKESFAKSKFKLKDSGRIALPHLLNWLRQKNPWFSGYCESLQDIASIQSFCSKLEREGSFLGKGPFSFDSSDAEEALGDEDVAMFLPTDELASASGSYAHLRAAATVICQAKVREPLPAEWLETCGIDLTDEDGKPLREIPVKLRQNQETYLQCICYMSVHVLVFVYMHRYMRICIYINTRTCSFFRINTYINISTYL